MSNETKSNLKSLVRDYLPALVVAAGVIASYSTMTARHEDAMRRIQAIEKTLQTDHDKVTGLIKDVEYIRKTVDQISSDIRKKD
jgi:peptidoglycan hydrolase CwlO-like protein